MPFQQLREDRTEFLPSADGGCNTRARAWNLQDNQYSDGFNIDISQQGVWGPRKGVSSLGGTEDLPGGLHFYRDQFNDIKLWGVWGSKLQRSTGGGIWQFRASGASFYSNVLHMIVDGTYNNANFAANQLQGGYICQCVPNSGVTDASRLAVFRTDNATSGNHYTQCESYAPRVITFFQGRLWKANDARSGGDGNDLAWSELDDGLTYSPANELSIEPGIGGRITGLWPLRSGVPRLIVFKESAIVYLEPKWGSSSALIPGAGDELDTLTSKVELLQPGVGCIATKSLTSAPGFAQGDVLYLARDGVRSLARASDDTVSGAGPRITDAVPDWIARINFAAAHKAVAAIYDDAYHLAVPMDGNQENSHIMRMELKSGAWSLHNWAARDIKQIPVSGDERFYFQYNSAFTEESTVTGLPSAPIYHLYRGYTGDEDPGATPVNYELVTKAFVYQNPKVEKYWDRILFLGTVEASETHSMTIAYRVDFQNWVTSPTAVVFGVPGSQITQGVTPLQWTAPTQKLIQRRIGLADVPPGTMLQIRFSGGDTALPSIYYTDVEARHHAQLFDNDR